MLHTRHQAPRQYAAVLAEMFDSSKPPEQQCVVYRASLIYIAGIHKRPILPAFLSLYGDDMIIFPFIPESKACRRVCCGHSLTSRLWLDKVRELPQRAPRRQCRTLIPFRSLRQFSDQTVARDQEPTQISIAVVESFGSCVRRRASL
jgi:hypothetical protein